MSQQLRDRLNKYKRKNNIKTLNPRKKRRKKKENFSQEDLEDLMCIRRPTYRRGRSGAMKQK